MTENTDKKINKIINFVFPILLLCAIVGAFIIALSAPVEIAEYENRYAEKIAKLTMQSFVNSDFQQSSEVGLADQLPFAEESKKLYNNAFSQFNAKVFSYVRSFFNESEVPQELLTDEEIAEIEIAAENKRMEEIRAQQIVEARGVRKDFAEVPGFMYVYAYGTVSIWNDHLINPFWSLEYDKSRLDPRIKNINTVISNHPDIDFYMYYFESEADVNFETGERNGIYEYIADNTNIPDDNKACYMLNSFADLDAYYFRTDHHLNCRGAQRAYRNLLKWLLPDEVALQPIAEWDVGKFSGSKTQGTLSSYYDNVIGYEYEWNENITLTINSAPAKYYGDNHNYINNAKTGNNSQWMSYGNYFGQDYGEVIFTNPDNENGNILLIGESYDNVVLELLAQHFSKLYSIDLRHYKNQIGKTFNFEEYVSSNDIRRVLFIGSRSLWDIAVFNIEE